MIVSWKLPVFAVVGLFGAAAFLCPACGRGGRAENPTPAASPSAASPASSGASAASVATAPFQTVEFDVAGMTCRGCATATEIALERLDGVRSAEAAYEDESGAGRAVVEYDPAKVSPERMIETVEAIGYHPTLRSPGGGGR